MVAQTRFVTINLEEIENKLVCRINCPKSSLPVYFKYKGEEKPYVRSGSSTIPLSPREWDDWKKNNSKN